jgi:hypothetical protein
VISLYARDGITPVDLVSYGEQTNDVSQGRYADGASALYFMPRATPRNVNSIPDFNAAPVFTNFPNQFAVPGQVVTITNRASDPDGDALTYSVDSAPEGFLVNQTGLFRWSVPTNQPPGEYPIALRVTDDGLPARSATATYSIIVTLPGNVVVVGAPPPVIRTFARPAGQATLTFEAEPGRTYRVLYTDDLGSSTWTQLDRDFVAATPDASITDVMTAAQRFYRVLRVD